MSKIDEAFERFCTKEGITSEQYKEEIRPAFEAGYRSGMKSKPEPEQPKTPVPFDESGIFG